MFMRILLPLDGTSRAEEVIPLARQLAGEPGAQVLLLHVDAVNVPTPANPAIAQRLEEVANELRAAGIETHVLSLKGEIPATIATVAELHGIDLIVMAPEARGALSMLRHPSVTAGVLAAKTTPPTLITPVVPDGDIPPMLDSVGDLVIAPLDGSPIAEQALPLAVKLAERYHRGLLLARVIPPIQAAVVGPGVYPLGEVIDVELREVQSYLREVKGRIQKISKIPVEWMALSGTPAPELLALIETKPGSVVVMSTHGRAGFTRFMLGSVALEIARKTTAPVFIVPATPANELSKPVTERKPADIRG